MAGEIQLNSTTMATESSGSITAELDTIRPNTTNGSLTLQGDSSNTGVTGLTIDSSGVVNTTTAKVTNIQATSGQSLTIKDEDGNAAITIGTDNTATGYLSLNFGSYHSGSGTLTGNTLSDYEEGTFQLSIDAGYTTNPGLGTNIGNYIKIGNVVHCHIRLDLDGTGTASSDDVEIGGLPFATLSSNSVRNTNFSGHFSAYGSTNLTENAYYFASTLFGDNSFRFYHFTASSIDGLIGTELGTNAVIIVDLTYFIAPFS